VELARRKEGIEPVTQLRPWLISFAVFAVVLVGFAAFASMLMNE
jgi:hypothetical protein